MTVNNIPQLAQIALKQRPTNIAINQPIIYFKPSFSLEKICSLSHYQAEQIADPELGNLDAVLLSSTQAHRWYNIWRS